MLDHTRLLTGERPFAADTPEALLKKHAGEAPPEPRSLNPGITPAANEFVLRLLRKKPEQRYPSYDQLLGALDAVGRSGAEGDGLSGLSGADREFPQ